MRVLGIIFIVIGVIWLVIAFNFDTSVETGYGADRIENIGLIAQRQNHLMVAGLVTLIGTLLAIFGGNPTTNTAKAPAPLPSQPPCERDLALDGYKLWLAQ